MTKKTTLRVCILIRPIVCEWFGHRTPTNKKVPVFTTTTTRTLHFNCTSDYIRPNPLCLGSLISVLFGVSPLGSIKYFFLVVDTLQKHVQIMNKKKYETKTRKAWVSILCLMFLIIIL